VAVMTGPWSQLDGDILEVLPPEAPLDMPVQDFRAQPPRTAPLPTSPLNIGIRRAIMIGTTLLVTIIASTRMAGFAAMDGIDLRETLLIMIFTPLFAWIALSFVSAVAGFLCMIGAAQHDTIAISPVGRLRHRTAVLSPVYNEDIEEVLARLRRMADQLAATGQGDMFDMFILSDSTRPEAREAERAAYLRMRERFPVRLYYRLRPKNVGRKPGNIAEWIGRFGDAYEHMFVLDADSLVDGRTIVRLAATMERRPRVGLIQTVPRIVGARTLFARWQQFTSSLYGSIGTAGLIWWSGAEAGFWGHNAIVRTRAFADSCGLPSLPGPEPLGGPILSHDLVEAAMLRRSGWAVHMVDLPGSYEETPPSTIDHAIRDRRWCQGNAQHVRLLHARGFHWVSRLQLLMGCSAYFTSPMWLLLLIAGIAASLGTGSDWNHLPVGEVTIFVTLVLLFGPKLLGLAWTLADPVRRATFGGARRVLASTAIEIPLAMLLAPMVMMTQTIVVVDILRGRSSGWSAQRRQVDGITLGEAARFYAPHVLVGILLATAAIAAGQSIGWVAPVAIGLVAAPFICMATSRGDAGDWFARHGLFRSPNDAVDLPRPLRVVPVTRPDSRPNENGRGEQAPRPLIRRGYDLVRPAGPLSLALRSL
jgi:membrane glycosyltransferase